MSRIAARVRLLVAALAGCLAALPASGLEPPHLETFDRVWTLVRDRHFDPELNGVDWTRVRDDLRPLAARAQTIEEARRVIRKMLATLGQSHFVLVPGAAAGTAEPAPDRGGDPGFDVRLIDTEMIVTATRPEGPAARAGVRPGWTVAAVDGRSVGELLSALPADLPGRLRQVQAWQMTTGLLRGPRGSPAHVAFLDATGRPVARSLRREPEEGEPVKVGHLPELYVRVETEQTRSPGGATVGVIRFNVWMTPVAALVDEAVDRFRSAQGLVFDLRGNPGGLAGMLIGLAGHFLERPASLGTLKMRDAELQFFANPRRVSADGRRVEPYGGPLVILVDGLTGSASECFAAGLQALGRAHVIGQHTMGQALPSLFERLPNGDVLIHAHADFIAPDGVSLEGRGVSPDRHLSVSRADLLAGRDGPLEAALAWIDANPAP